MKKEYNVYYNGVLYDVRHGGPFDRGAADSWYSRAMDPHFYVDGTHRSARIEKQSMTEDQIAEYIAGYEYNERFGGKKEW